MATSTLEMNASMYSDDSSSDVDHTDKLLSSVRELIPETEFISDITIAREPYQLPVFVIKVSCDAQKVDSLEGEVSLKHLIIKKIGEKKKGERFFITFPTDLNHANARFTDDSYLSLCDLLLEDFSLGAFKLVPLNFHQSFKHSVQFIAAKNTSRLSVAFDERKLSVNFAVSNLPITDTSPEEEGDDQNRTLRKNTEVYRLRLLFSNFERNIFVHEQGNVSDLYILLTAPLELWRTRSCLKRVAAVNDDVWWCKTVRLKSENQKSAINLSELVGDCRVLKLSLKRDGHYARLMNSFKMNEFVLNYTHVNKKILKKEKLPHRLSMGDFNCDWYLQALHSLGYHTRMQFGQELKEFVFSNKGDCKLLQALERAYITIMQKDQHAPLLRTVKFYFENPRQMDELTPKYNCYIRRVIVTPTRKVYLPQSLMHENRVLRNFDREFALSVTFRNEDYSKLNDQFSSQEFTRETVSDTLKEGIRISQRHYQFLGCSNSQQKNHACWFYAKDEKKVDAASIRSWVGNLDEERLPGKFIARVGQVFSRTKPVDLKEFTDLVLEMKEDDVIGGTKNYCFTDGVGRISRQMLNKVFERLDEPYIPTALQIRLGGCKGMLALDPTLEGLQILIRKSMNKFDCPHRQLEVVRIATPIRLYLNRQIITLLSHHRGPSNHLAPKDRSGIVGGSREFTRLLLVMLFDLADSFLDEKKAALSLGSRASFPCPFSDLVNAGYSLMGDPFFRDMCQAAAKQKTDLVKRKFNVELPPEEARNMFGVVDETGRLEYGQVFIRYSADHTRPGHNPMVVLGKVLVSKMPCVHPGDVRVFRAVKVDALCHHLDCIVFPQKGPRPHPDEMAGSDLDGDEYFVTWRQELLLRNPNCEPMDYSPNPSAPSRPAKKTPVNETDMIEFIVEYINSDQIGPVASSLVTWADQKGIYSKECMELCQLHSDVIDSQKTGQVVEGRTKKLRPFRYPDFMDKMDHKETYRSKGVLGRYFRISRRILIILSERLPQDWSLDERFIIEGYAEFLDSARELRDGYEASLQHIQQEYGVADEVDLVSNCCMDMNSPMSQAENDDYNTKKLVKGKCESLFELTRQRFYGDLGLEEGTISMPVLWKASACYKVVYGEPDRKFHSFPWIFGDALALVLKHFRAATGESIPPFPDNPRYKLLRNSVNSITDEETYAYLKSFEKLFGEFDPADRKIFHVFLNWYHWCPPWNEPSTGTFIKLLKQALLSVKDPKCLLQIFSYLGLNYCSKSDHDGKSSENFIREIAIARFRLALHCDWRALEIPGHQIPRISQTITIVKKNWIALEDYDGEGNFQRYLKSVFPDCSFKIRPSGRTSGLLHVIGPAMKVYEVMDMFNEKFESFVNPGRGNMTRSAHGLQRPFAQMNI